VVAGVVPAEKRSTAFGLFDTGFGTAWLLGSAAMGLLYDKSIPALILFSVGLQAAALPVLFFANLEKRILKQFVSIHLFLKQALKQTRSVCLSAF